MGRQGPVLTWNKQECFPFPSSLKFAPENSRSIGNTDFSSSNPLWKILLAAECSSFSKADLGLLWEKNFRNQFWRMEKPFENNLSHSSNNVCLIKGKSYVTSLTQCRKHVPVYIQKELWIYELGGLVAAPCITTEGIKVQDFSCGHSS